MHMCKLRTASESCNHMENIRKKKEEKSNKAKQQNKKGKK